MENQVQLSLLQQELEKLKLEIASCRKREQAAREAESYYRAFFEKSTDGIVILDPESARPIEFNDQACRQLGYTRDEFAQIKVQDIEDLETDSNVKAHIRSIISKGFDEFETRHRTKSGEIRNVYVQAQVIQVGKKSVYHCIWRDITESKRMENSLRESEDRFRLTFSSNPDAVTINRLDDGVYVEVNEGFCRITGYTREEVIGKSSVDLGVWDDPKVRACLVGNLEERGYSENLETTFRRKDGSVIIGLMSARIITLHGVPHNIAVSRDITQHKLYEKERLKIEKLESLGILAGGIAHDFNNVLTGIVGNLSFARVFLDDAHKAVKPLQNAEKAAFRAGELAHQLLTFSRGGEPVKKLVDVKNLIEEALSLTLHGSKVSHDSIIPGNIHAIEADEGQISQVFYNIIINAVQAMPNGGIFRITAENILLKEANRFSLHPGPYVRVVLADQGDGIPLDNLEKIFDPYFTTKQGGNGLGLASAYSIINRHNGHINVQSTIDRGTVFSIYLPSIGETIGPAKKKESSQTVSTQGEGRVLVMDDEAMVLDVAADILTHLGNEVTICNNGVDAVSIYEESLASGKTFKAVFMDLTIPGGMGGKQAAQQILQLHPEANLIVSSGYSNDPVISNYKQYGFRAAITKPYTFLEFENILNTMVKESSTGLN